MMDAETYAKLALDEAAQHLAYGPIHQVQFWRLCSNIDRATRQEAIRRVVAACEAELDDCERDSDLVSDEIPQYGRIEEVD